MVVLSASDIAALLHYSPVTVRRWIAHHDVEGVAGLPDPGRDGPGSAHPRIGERITVLLATPKTDHRSDLAGTRPPRHQPANLLPTDPGTGPLGHPTPDRQRRPRPRHHLRSIRDQITALPAGSVVLAEDETHLDLLVRVRAC
jgi:hypothetical protein